MVGADVGANAVHPPGRMETRDGRRGRGRQCRASARTDGDEDLHDEAVAVVVCIDLAPPAVTAHPPSASGERRRAP